MTKGLIFVKWEYQKEKKQKGSEAIFEAIVTKNFSKLICTKPQV